jgi:1-acyl-sn-glycerol-3-phosphate acyltransferase
MRWMTATVDLLATLLLWGYFTVGFVLLFAPFYLLAAAAAGDRAGAFQRLNHFFYRGFFLLCQVVMPRQRWRIDPALKQVRASVVVCNHVSYIDPLLLIAQFPRHTTIVKNRLFSIPVFGWMLGLSGYLPAAAHGRLAEKMIACMGKMPEFLAAGGNLIVFPEGTRSRTGVVGELNPGAFKIARRFHAPIAVAAIENSQRLFTPGRFVFNACRANTITVRMLAGLTPDYDSTRFSTQALMEDVRKLLSAQTQAAA